MINIIIGVIATLSVISGIKLYKKHEYARGDDNILVGLSGVMIFTPPMLIIYNYIDAEFSIYNIIAEIVVAILGLALAMSVIMIFGHVWHDGKDA